MTASVNRTRTILNLNFYRNYVERVTGSVCHYFLHHNTLSRTSSSFKQTKSQIVCNFSGDLCCVWMQTLKIFFITAPSDNPWIPCPYGKRVNSLFYIHGPANNFNVWFSSFAHPATKSRRILERGFAVASPESRNATQDDLESQNAGEDVNRCPQYNLLQTSTTASHPETWLPENQLRNSLISI